MEQIRGRLGLEIARRKALLERKHVNKIMTKEHISAVDKYIKKIISDEKNIGKDIAGLTSQNISEKKESLLRNINEILNDVRLLVSSTPPGFLLKRLFEELNKWKKLIEYLEAPRIGEEIINEIKKNYKTLIDDLQSFQQEITKYFGMREQMSVDERKSEE